MLEAIPSYLPFIEAHETPVVVESGSRWARNRRWIIEKKPNLIRSEEIAGSGSEFSHPLNPDSLMTGFMISRMTGMERAGVSLARVTPGHESFVYHAHESEEEWVYIISGSGIAEIDGEEYEVGPGDFMGFPTPSVAHNLRNASDSGEDLVYLMGGESREVEIADFPKLGKRLIRTPGKAEIIDADDAKPMFDSE